MEDRLESLERLLEERAAQSAPGQIVGWACGGMERAFVLRLQEIEHDLRSFERRERARTETDELRSARKGLDRRDQLRIQGAVESFFASMTDIGNTLGETWSDLPSELPPTELPQEHRLIIGRLLTDQGAIDGAASQLMSEVRSIAEMRYAEALLADEMIRRGSPASLDSLLVLAWSAFEEVLLALVRLAILMSTGADETDDSGEDSRRLMAAASKTIRGGPARWRSTVVQLTDFDPGDLVPSWSALVEIYLRRNVIVHCGGRVDRRYLEGLTDPINAPEPGAQLITTSAYVRDSVSLLLAVGAGMAMLWPSLLSSEERPTLNRPIELVVRLLRAQAWGEAECVSRALQRFTDDPHVVAPLKVNEWMAQRESAGGVAVIESLVRGWEPPDESHRVVHGDRLVPTLDQSVVHGADLSEWPAAVVDDVVVAEVEVGRELGRHDSTSTSSDVEAGSIGPVWPAT